MLSLFPSLLIFGIFAPLVLRVAAGIFLLVLGFRHSGKDREALAKELSGHLGGAAPAFAVTFGIIEISIGVLLIAGFLTQLAALLGIILALKALWFKAKRPTVAPHEKTTYLLLLAVLISLLFLGAGAPAIDLPL